MNNQANIVSAAVTSKESAWANAEVIDYQLNDQLVLRSQKPLTLWPTFLP